MKVFHHLVYEYQKGLRDLCLFTCVNELESKVIKLLKYQNISYIIQAVGHDKINVFFGNRDCLDIVEQFSSQNLNVLSAEEDFMLGIMLGYAKPLQYARFLVRKKLAA